MTVIVFVSLESHGRTSHKTNSRPDSAHHPCGNSSLEIGPHRANLTGTHGHAVLLRLTPYLNPRYGECSQRYWGGFTEQGGKQSGGMPPCSIIRLRWSESVHSAREAGRLVWQAPEPVSWYSAQSRKQNSATPEGSEAPSTAQCQLQANGYKGRTESSCCRKGPMHTHVLCRSERRIDYGALRVDHNSSPKLV